MPDTKIEQLEQALIPTDMRARLVFISLIVSNLLPLYGVLWGGWDVFTVMLLYWAENVVVGLYTVAKMVTIYGWGDGYQHGLSALIPIPFFVLHYGGFCFGHGIVLSLLLRPDISHGSSGMLNNAFALTCQQLVLHPASSFTFTLLGIFISHGQNFLYQFLQQGEYRAPSARAALGNPYNRVILLHVTLIFGAFLIIATGTRAAMIAVLVLLKLGIELLLYWRTGVKQA
jgi:hypothetical protein